jgi:hypothetical protein
MNICIWVPLWFSRRVPTKTACRPSALRDQVDPWTAADSKAGKPSPWFLAGDPARTATILGGRSTGAWS